MKKKVIVISYVGFLKMFCISVFSQTDSDLYYVDLHTQFNSFFLACFIKVLGANRVGNMFVLMFKIFGKKLCIVPWGDMITDYHLIQIEAEKKTLAYVSQCALENETNYQDRFLFSGISDEVCLQSFYYKDTCRLVSRVVESIHIIKKIEQDATITIILATSSVPLKVLCVIKAAEGIALRYMSGPRLAGIFYTGLIGSTHLVVAFFRYFFRFLIKKNFIQGRYVAFEYVDPMCQNTDCTTPSYFDNSQLPMITYVRREQQSYFKRHKTLGCDVVYLNKIPYTKDNLQILAQNIVHLIRFQISNYTPYSEIFLYIKSILLLVDLRNFFCFFPIKTHVFHTFPNGRCSVRYDSGIVTGVCRQFNVMSVSYQTRTMYCQHHLYYFDAFDAFYVWGKAWLDLFLEKSKVSYIKQYEMIGNVYCNRTQAISVDNEVHKIVLFTSDIETVAAQHYTLSYAIDFLKASLRAVYLANRVLEKQCVVYLQAKRDDHYHILMANHEIHATLEQYNMQLLNLREFSPDMMAAIQFADMVISIGFTTPGLIGLLSGKKSIYYTPYEYRYNGVFSPDSHIVATSADQLFLFITREQVINKKYGDDLLGTFDDARQNLINIIKKNLIINQTYIGSNSL